MHFVILSDIHDVVIVNLELIISCICGFCYVIS